MKKLALLLSLLLAGCASEQATESRYYLLPLTAVEPIAAIDSPLLMVKTNLSEYLNNQGLVYRTSATQVVHAKHSLWAQAIKQQLTQRIIRDLQSKQTHYWPIAANSLLDMNDKQQLLVSLQRFNGVYTGVAEIAGEWLLIDPEGQVLRNESFHIEVPLQTDGYDALLSSLSSGLAQLTDLLAEQL